MIVVKFGITFNLSGFSLDEPHKNIIPHLDDLKYAIRKVSELALELKEQDWKRYQLYKHCTYSAVASVIVGVIMTHIVYKLYMYSRGHCNTSCPRIGARRLGEVRTPPELRSQDNTVNINISVSNERGRDSVVGIATRYGLESPGFE